MGSLAEDVQSGASWIAEALASSGYAGDFSPASLAEVDRFIDEQSKRGKPRRRGLLSKDLGSRLFALGAYVGEVIRRSVGGEWLCDDADPQGEINVAIRLPDGSIVWPVQRVMKRFTLGPEEGIAVYGAAVIERGSSTNQ